MKILEILYPIKLHLTVLQLEGYNNSRFLYWISKNFFIRKLSLKKGFVSTAKAKLLMATSIAMNLIIIAITYRATHNLLAFLVISFLISTQTYVVLLISAALIKIPEYFIKIKIVEKTRTKILSLKNLKVIAIAGSYGKTSTKEVLYQLIKDSFKTLRTPESYNTVLGVSKVIDLELDKSYEFFISEMAAYGRGEISELCYMVPPKYGILTGITTQHLERFGNLENIIKAKFELYESIENKNNVILNLEDTNIRNELNKRHVKLVQGYIKPIRVSFSKNGSIFEFVYKGRKYKANTKLFGIQNVENILGALTLALNLGIDIRLLLTRVKNLEPAQSRLLLKMIGNSVLVDNTYSSNEEAFKETISTAKMLRGKKAIITPGLVELGKNTELINNRIGNATYKVFDKIVLVGRNIRTKAFSKNFSKYPEFISDNRKDYSQTIDKLKDKYDWIFLENDLSENY